MPQLSAASDSTATAPRVGLTAVPKTGRYGLGYSLVTIGAALFILNAGVSRLVLDAGVDPARLTSIRSFGTAVVLGTWLLVSGRWRNVRVTRHDVPLILLYGVFGVALTQWLYFVAIQRLPIGIALLLEFLAPLLIALWARFVVHEPVRALIWPALALAIGGLALVGQVFQGGADLDPLGVIAGLSAAVVLSVYYLGGERLVTKYDPFTTTFLGFSVAAVVTSMFSPWWQIPTSVLTSSVPAPPALGSFEIPVIALLTSVIVLGTVLPFAAGTAALRHIPATAVSLLATLEPIGAACLAWWWFDEKLAPNQLVGVVMVVFGIALAIVARPASANDQQPSEPVI